MNDWLPMALPDLLVWLTNFVAKLKEYQSTFNTDSGEIKTFDDDILWLTYYINLSEQIEADKKGVNGEKKTYVDGAVKATMSPVQSFNYPPAPGSPITPGLRKRIRNLAARIKLMTAVYTEAIGLEMGIAIIKPAPAISTFKVEPKEVSAQANDKVKITFSLGIADAVCCEMSLDGMKYKKVGTPNYSPYFDETESVNGKSEKRFYRFQGMIKGNVIGELSNIYTVQTIPD